MVVASHQEPGLLAECIARFVPPGVDPSVAPAFVRADRAASRSGPGPTRLGTVPRSSRVRTPSSPRSPSTQTRVSTEPARLLALSLRNGFVTEVWAKQPFRIDDDGTVVPNYDARSKSLYQAHPWVLAVRGDGSAFGVLADTTYRLGIDLRDGSSSDLRRALPRPRDRGRFPARRRAALGRPHRPDRAAAPLGARLSPMPLLVLSGRPRS